MKMKVKETPAGLLLAEEYNPHREVKAAQNDLGRLEIQDEAKRALAQQALDMLWEAMDLEWIDRGARMPLPGDEGIRMNAHYQAWWYLGKMMLEEDCKGGATLT